jgi:DNA-binding transcriptional MerR regulator
VSAELEQYRDSELGLEGLVSIVQEILDRSATAPADARVAEIPDARTLRYYQTIGALDKPLRYDGRRAVYGYRHLLQALGVKLLQGQGYSLAQIRQALSDIGNAELERVVVDTLGELQSVPSVPPPISSGVRLRGQPEGKPLIAVEVGQGVSVILDPAHVVEPEIVLVAMRELLSAIQEEM